MKPSLYLFLFSIVAMITPIAAAQEEQESQELKPVIPPEQSEMGNWIAISHIDRNTGKPYATIRLNQDNPKPDTRPVTLLITCPNHNLELYINWRTSLYGETNVMTSIDLNRVQSRNWRMAVGDAATFYSGVTGDFINELLQGKVLNTEIYPRGGDAVSASFTLEGIDAAFGYVQEVCEF